MLYEVITYYQITEKGEAFLSELEASWKELNETVNHLANI